MCITLDIQVLFFFFFEHLSVWTGKHEQINFNPQTKQGLTPTLLRERLFEDALIKAAEGGAEVLEVREAEMLVPQLRDRQTVLGLWGRRGRRRGLLEAQGLGRGL